MSVNLNIRIEQELRDEFKKVAEQNAHNPSGLIRKWIENYIENNKEELTMEKEFYALLEEKGKELNHDLVRIEFNKNSIEIEDEIEDEDVDDMIIGQEGKKFYGVYEAYDFMNANGLLE